MHHVGKTFIVLPSNNRSIKLSRYHNLSVLLKTQQTVVMKGSVPKLGTFLHSSVTNKSIYSCVHNRRYFGRLITHYEIWSVDCSEGLSCYSNKSVAVANIDNDLESGEKVIIGSYTGILRVIGDPSSSFTAEDGHSRPNAVVLAELNLGFPILQVEAGIFISGSDKINLAILHPQKLAVYSISKLVGQVEHGSQYKVTLLYEHQLKRHAFNMCCGAFGHGTSSIPVADNVMGTKKGTRQFVCVQALDGTVSFFEQELYTFSRYLPGFLLPGPLAYVPSWDSFLTVTSWNLVCFRYTSLAMAKDDPYQQQFQDTSVGKKLTPDWSFTVGEECIGDIQVLGTNDPSTTQVVLCTFRNIFCFGESSQLIWSKRLDYQISAFHSYLIPADGQNECIFMTGSSVDPYTCYVYNRTTLRWAAKLPFHPVHLSRVNIVGHEGVIVALSPDGKLVVGCLGTVPSLFVAPPVQARDLDYESAERELYDLRKAISDSADQSILANKDNSLEVKLEFEGQKTKWMESNGMEVISLIGVLKIICHLRVNDVRVTISAPKPLTCSPESVLIGDIIGRHSYQVEFFVENESVPSGLQCDIFVFYISDSGAPHLVTKCDVKIPLFIVARPQNHLEKDADVKLTFSINRSAINLPSIYNDFEWTPEGSQSGITFVLYGGEKVSMLSSTKSATGDFSKYRIQSSSLAAIYIIFRDFIDRVKRKLGHEKPPLSIIPVGFDNEIPLLNDYFNEIDAHILRRRRDLQIKEELANRAAQLRAVQRRLLVRFRDKNPLPLTQLEILFEGSLDQVGDCLNFMEENELEKQKLECRLSGATKLLLELIELKKSSSIENEQPSVLNALNSHIWNFTEEYGWEECVYTGLTYMRSQVVVNQTFLNLDVLKFRKAIKWSVDKILKASSTKLRSASAQQLQRTNESSVSAEIEKLIGNEIVERMTSARGRLGRRMNPTLASIPEPSEPSDEHSYGHPPRNEQQVISNNNSKAPIQRDDSTETKFKLELEEKITSSNKLRASTQPEIDDDNFW